MQQTLGTDTISSQKGYDDGEEQGWSCLWCMKSHFGFRSLRSKRKDLQEIHPVDLKSKSKVSISYLDLKVIHVGEPTSFNALLFIFQISVQISILLGSLPELLTKSDTYI